jgi:hypothetical protein
MTIPVTTPFNRVRFRASAGGTGDFGVASAITGFNTPAQRGIPDNTVVSYTAESDDQTQWETGQGTYAAGTLSRDTILENSNSDTNAVNFSAAPTVWIDLLAQDFNRKLDNDSALSYAGLGELNIGAAGVGTGKFDILGTTSGTVTLTVADAAGTWTLKLPTTDGNNGEFLQTNGSGVTTWAAGGSGITIGSTAITSGTTKRVLYDLAGVVEEASAFTIESNQPNVTAGNKYLYNGEIVIQAITGASNYFFGGGGNLTLSNGSNIGVGPSPTMSSLTSGQFNVAIGTRCFQSATSSSFNIAIGDEALKNANTGASECIAIGLGAMKNGSAGNRNIAIGDAALEDLAGGADNVAIGVAAGANITSGSSNFALGQNALNTATGASSCVAIGQSALLNCNANDNVAIGQSAGQAVTSGGTNTLIGRAAGNAITTGGNNVVIGQLAGTTTLNATILIGDGAGNQRIQADANGIYLNTSATYLLRTQMALTDNAAGSTGTLTNAPAAGNPTKWIAIDDNGTPRYIPAW